MRYLLMMATLATTNHSTADCRAPDYCGQVEAYPNNPVEVVTSDDPVLAETQWTWEPATKIIIGDDLAVLDYGSGKLDVQCAKDKCTQAARVFLDHVAWLAGAHCEWGEPTK